MPTTIVVALLWIAALTGLAEAKSAKTKPPIKEITVTAFEITYDAQSPNLLQWFAKLRVSKEGQNITKTVASYYGVPTAVVDYSTNEFWMKQVQDIRNEGNEHHGRIESPAGYGVCEAHRLSETSITGPSTLNVALVRMPYFNGFGWYAAVPNPSGLGAGGNWARAVWQITFVKTDPAIWNKHKAKCTPKDFVVPAHYVIEECKGTNCTGVRRLF